MSELSDWLDSTAEKREELLNYARSPIPTDIGLRQLDVSKALTMGQDAGDMLADLEKHLIDETARFVLLVNKENTGLSTDERRSVVKSKVSGISRLRDGLHVVYTSIKDRRFALMNLNRS